MLSKSFQITNQYGTPFYKISGNGDSLAGIANFFGIFFFGILLFHLIFLLENPIFLAESGLLLRNTITISRFSTNFLRKFLYHLSPF